MTHVVVVGAGVAGQATARLLSHQTGLSVTVLEATGRTGGRIKSTTVGKETIDLGASWMHMIRDNALFDEGLRQNWPMGFTDALFGHYTEKGPVKPAAGILPIVEDVQSMIAEDFHQEKPLKAEGSLKTYLTTAISSMPLITPEQARLAILFSRQVEHFVGQPWGDIPAGEGGSQHELGRNAFVYGKGYTQVLDWLYATTNWDAVELQLDAEVERILRNSEGEGFVVQIKGFQDITCDFVVCTVPLGALKLMAGHLFQTLEIPEPLEHAIAQTDTAALGKVVLRFDRPFWNTDEQELVVVHTETEEIVSVVSPFAAESATLIILTAPPITQYVESHPSLAFQKLRWALEAIRLDPSLALPEPLECIVSDWTQQRHFRGSYSARSIGQTFSGMVQPFIDGAGPLRFAGEHTVFDGNGCVHGAYNSGIREALYICASLKDK